MKMRNTDRLLSKAEYEGGVSTWVAELASDYLDDVRCGRSETLPMYRALCSSSQERQQFDIIAMMTDLLILPDIDGGEPSIPTG